MENIDGLNLILHCRLCGVGGQHEIDISEENSLSNLSEKICRCVGVQVRPDDEDTKICQNCFDQINTFYRFRVSCAAKNVNFVVRKMRMCNVDQTAAAIDVLDLTQDNDDDNNENASNESNDSNIPPPADPSSESDFQPESPLENQAPPIMCISLSEDETESEVEGCSKQNIANTKRYSSAECDGKMKGKSSNVQKKRIFSMKCTQENCKQFFESSDAIGFHKKTFLAKGIKHIFECHLCKQRLSSKPKLNEHMKSVHTGQRSTIFQIKKSLRSHINALHTKKSVFKFTKCPMVFYRKSSLIGHSTIHPTVAAFRCRLCKQSFAKKSLLQWHVTSIHSGQHVSCVHTRSARVP